MMPAQKPGSSKQDYETPDAFLRAVTERFGVLEVDLAARRDNAKCSTFLTPEADSLSCDWGHYFGRNCWLNPPFGSIPAWAKKCAHTMAARGRRPTRILLLTPASVATEWFAEHVEGKALVLPLRPRLAFVGEKDPFPKDLMLSVYGERPGFETWRWRP